MKKISSIIIIFIIMLCFSACKGDADKKYTNLPTVELRTHENSSGFHREYKTEYEYDEKGNVIKKTEYTKGVLGTFSVREKHYDISYTYNENGDVSQELIRIEDFCTSITDGHQIYNEGYNYFYNENRQLIKKEMLNSAAYVDGWCGYIYEYDEFGNCVKEYKYFNDNTKKLDCENIYDTQNNLIKKQKFEYLSNFDWLDIETQYTYDEGGRMASSKAVDYGYSGEKEHSTEAKYYYDERNRLIKEERTSYYNNGEIDQTDIKEYKYFAKKEN